MRKKERKIQIFETDLINYDHLKLTARLVQSRSADISDPFDHVVIAVIQFRFEHLQIADFQSGRRERNLKFKNYY